MTMSCQGIILTTCSHSQNYNPVQAGKYSLQPRNRSNKALMMSKEAFKDHRVLSSALLSPQVVTAEVTILYRRERIACNHVIGRIKH